MLMSLAWFAVTSVAVAAPNKRILVSSFEPRVPRAAAFGMHASEALESTLEMTPHLTLVRVDELPPVFDTSAALYASTCPPGQFIGCGYVLGQTGEVDLVVVGTVEPLVEGMRAEIHILDVERTEDLLAFQIDLAEEDTALLARGIAAVVAGVARGEVAVGGDIRVVPSTAAADTRAKEQEVARNQLDGLEREIGDVGSVDRLERGVIRDEKISMTDLADELDREGVKPWERLDMEMEEYVRYRNSGAQLHEWRKRTQGRRQQLILRPFLGYANGPSRQRYFGQYLQAADDFSTLETYAWQSTRSGSGLTYGGYVGYGLLPTVELGITVGGALGSFTYEVQKQIEQQDPTQLPSEAESIVNAFIGPEVVVALRPTSVARPVFGAGVVWGKAEAIVDLVALPPDLPGFPASSFVMTHAMVGGEVSISEAVDLFLHLPVTMVVGGNTSRQVYDGSGLMVRSSSPGDVGPLGAGVRVGFQVRLLGVKASSGPEEFLEEPD